MNRLTGILVNYNEFNENFIELPVQVMSAVGDLKQGFGNAGLAMTGRPRKIGVGADAAIRDGSGGMAWRTESSVQARHRPPSRAMS
jgi:hypothetical protein